MTLNRLGCAAMQLAGPEVWGMPRDVDGAVAVLREAVASGANHIDTSDYYNLIGDMRAVGAEGNRRNRRDRA